VEGLDIAKIAREVGRDRTTVARWFTDPLVVEELDRQVEDQYETELQRQANLRAKALGVVETALDQGDLKAALAILGRTPQRHVPSAERIRPPLLNPFAAAPGSVGPNEIEEARRLLQVTSPWQLYLQRADALIQSPRPVSDEKGILDRLLLLEQVGGEVVRVLEIADGEGLPGYSSVDGQQQTVLLGDARKAIEQAWAIVGGSDEDENPGWPGEEGADRAARLFGEALLALLGSLEGAAEVLTSGACKNGAGPAARLIRAREAGRQVVDGGKRRTIPSLGKAVTTLTAGFEDLIGALGEGATVNVDAGWAEGPDRAEGGADA